MSEPHRQLPPYVYLPCRLKDEGEDFDPELHQGEAGPGLLVYTALDRLRRVWGQDQEWAVVQLNLLGEVQQRTGFVSLLVDDGLPESERAGV